MEQIDTAVMLMTLRVPSLNFGEGRDVLILSWFFFIFCRKIIRHSRKYGRFAAFELMRYQTCLF